MSDADRSGAGGAHADDRIDEDARARERAMDEEAAKAEAAATMAGGGDLPKGATLRNVPGLGEGHKIHCPSCGRYIGPVERCPYCHFEMPKKRSYEALKWGSLAWGIVGILLVWYIFANVATPEMTISELGPENNYGRFIVKGTVIRSMNYYPSEFTEYGTLYFTVDDGTGEIQCICYEDCVQTMVDQGKYPAFGDQVTVEGTYQYRDYRYSMLVDSADHIDIVPQAPLNTTVAFIDNSIADSDLMTAFVSVEGYVSDYDLYDYALSIYITDKQGHYVNVYVPSYVWQLTGEGDFFLIQNGDKVHAEGALLWYEAGSYSRWELIPAESSGFYIVTEVA